MRPLWQYRVLQIVLRKVGGGSADPAELEESLNRLGRKGWELVGVAPIAVTGTSNRALLFFRREVVSADRPADDLP